MIHAAVTYFAVLPFSRTENGDFLAEAVILGRYGDVPDDLTPYTSD